MGTLDQTLAEALPTSHLTFFNNGHHFSFIQTRNFSRTNYAKKHIKIKKKKKFLNIVKNIIAEEIL